MLDSWVQWTNAHGGVAGHPVELSAKDDKADPGQGLAAARELIESDKVLALVGDSAVYTESAFADVVSQNRVPVIGGIAYSQLFNTNPMFYAVGPDQLALLYGEMFVAKELVKADKVGLLLCDTANVCDVAVPVFQNFAKQLGLDLSALVRAGNVAPDYTAQCLAIQQSGAKVMIVAGPPVEKVANDCARQGYKPAFMVVDGVGITASIAKKTKPLEGAFGTLSGFPVYNEFPETKDFFAAMKEFHPEYFDDGDKYDLLSGGSVAALAWAGGQAFAKAVVNSGVAASAEVTREDVIRGLAAFKDETLGGITPKLTYSDGSKPNPRGMCFYVMTIKDGALTPVNGLDTPCQP